MRALSFATARPESTVLRWVRRAVVTVAYAYLVLFCWSIYRRIWQVLRVEISVSSAELVPGSTVAIDVVTTGEVRNRILLELLQESHSEALLELNGRLQAVNALDPRVFRYTPSVTITSGLLSRFSPGPATLRLTGFGAQKLLRTPAPRTRELQVRLEPPRAPSGAR